MYKHFSQELLEPAKQMQTEFLPKIKEQTASLDAGKNGVGLCKLNVLVRAPAGADSFIKGVFSA